MDSGRDVAVTGVGLVPMAQGHGRPFYDVAHEAAGLALRDAGLRARDLDSVVLAGLDLECGRTISNMYTAPAAGGYLKDEIRVADDGLYAAALAWMRLRAGLFDTTMVLAYGLSSEGPMEHLANLVFDPVLQRPFGLGRVGALALQAEAYRHAAPGADEAADAVAARNRAAGSKNPEALGLPPLEPRGAHEARYTAAPLRASHVAPLCDGAAALVLQAKPAPAARAGRLLGFGWACESGDLGQRELARLVAAERAAGQAFRRAGLAPGDVGVVECHDVTAYHELMALEALGFAAEGEAPPLALHAGGAGKQAPRVNASGGSLSGEPSVASGLYKLAWCVRAVRELGGHALAHASGGPAAQSACVGLVGSWA